MRILLVLLLAGCVSQEQLAKEKEARDIAYTRELAEQCVSVGYQRGTEPFMQCVVQLHGQRQAAVAGILGAYASHPQAPVYRPIPRPQQPYTNCTKDPWGNLSCSSW